MDKRAILAASFGTSHRGTLDKTIGAVERSLAEAFPGQEVRRAFTSGMVIRRLKDRDGLCVDTVAQALTALAEEGVREVVVQPTHLIAGGEYEKVLREAQALRGRFAALRMGAPLLASPTDYRLLAGALSLAFPQRGNAAVCLMGHGSEHPANSAYAAMEYHFRDIGREDIFVGTVEGYPDLEAVMRRLRRFPAEELTLAPLLLVAGDHAGNDMAGGAEGSWKNRLEAAGYRVRCVLRGLGEYPAVRDLYAAHAGEAKPL